MLAIFAVVVITTTLGIFASRRWGKRADDASNLIMTVVLWGLLPIVLFFNLARFELTTQVGTALAFAHVAQFSVLIAAYAAGRWLLQLGRPARGTLITCALLGNTAYLGFPFTAAALGFDQLGAAVSYDTLVMMPSLLLVGFSVGAAFGTHAQRPSERVRSFFTKNPVLYAAVAALLVPNSFAPDWTLDLTRLLVVAILPLGFFAVGVTLQHEAEEDRFSFPPPLTTAVGTAVLLKLTLPPAVLALLSMTVSKVPDAYLLQAAMASGINNLLIAHNYGLDRKLAAAAIIYSTALVALAGLLAALL